MTYVKTYLPTLKTHVVNLKRDANDLSRDLQQLEVRGKLGSKTLYCCSFPLEKMRIPRGTAVRAHFVVINKGARRFYLNSATR